MLDVVSHVTKALAGRSSRRQLIKFIGASSLGTGLALTGTGVSIADAQSCCAVGCGGGPCPTCASPAPPCGTGCGTCFDGCPCGSTCTNEWFCCDASNCQVRCSECCVNGLACSNLNIRTGTHCGGGAGCAC
jgi:hypothetical protein